MSVNRAKPSYFLPEDIVTFVCDSGYGLSSGAGRLTCKSDGSWDSEDTEPKCHPGLRN